MGAGHSFSPSVSATYVVYRDSQLSAETHFQRKDVGAAGRAMTHAPVNPKSHHSRRPRARSCDSMTDSSNCALFNSARPLLELLMGSLSIRRSAAASRSRARSKSATVYCRGSRRVRFLRGRFGALLPRMSCFPAAAGAPTTQPIHILTHVSHWCMKQPITALS
jgi:hypothetical protein